MAAQKKKTTSTKAPAAKKSSAARMSYEPVVAKKDDGEVQITFTLAWSDIEKNRKKVVEKLSETVTVPGFRKGKAPFAKALEHLPSEDVIEKTLQLILPQLVGEAIQKNSLRPAIYPKFELISAEEGKDWQIRARTAEFPEVKLGDYKKALEGELRASALWTPEKGKEAEKEAPSKEQKEQKVLETLLKTVKIEIPDMLIQEEVNSRLSQLLSKIEKLGINLESYLASTGKTPEALRKEYEKQSEQALAIDLILSKIAEDQKIEIAETEIDKAIEATAHADPGLGERLNTPEQRSVIAGILRRRTALENLTSHIG